MAIVAEGQRGRIYLAPTPEHEAIAAQAVPDWTPETELANDPRNLWCVQYGLETFADLFTPRQLVSLTTFCDSIDEVWNKVCADAIHAGMDEHTGQSYANVIITYLALSVDKTLDRNTTLCTWESPMNRMRGTFARQALPMAWDYAETNPFAGAGGDLVGTVHSLCEVLDKLVVSEAGCVELQDATSLIIREYKPIISTDPPYYDNVSYANLSDFFYVWLRYILGHIYAELFVTISTPKTHEMIADVLRHGGKEKSRRFFEEGMGCAFANVRQSGHPDYPVTIYYAFKQSESEGDEEEGSLRAAVASSGWETFLSGLIGAGFQITGTWPVRTELGTRTRNYESNALASSIVLVCRLRPKDAPVATRREFVNALRRELEEALLKMMHGNVAPVDLAQATIGPGMAVYSRYSKVIETDGQPLRVRAALQIINQELDTILSASEGEYDGDTRFCLAWFEQYGMNPGAFGEADVLARAKDTSVAGLADAGVLEAKAGKVRLLRREELPADWNPKADARVPVWECTQQLVRALQEQGEGGAARLCAFLGGKAEPARDLAYRLYSLCERKGWAQEALAYNSLVIAWPEITRLASNPNIALPQAVLFTGGEL